MGGGSLPGGTSGGGNDLFGMAPNVAGLLCYPFCCLSLVWSIYVAAAVKSSKAVRFHAFQSLLLGAAGIVIGGICWVMTLILSQLSGILGMLFSLVQFGVAIVWLLAAIFLAVKAYGNEQFELPVIGPMAKQWS